MNKLPKSIIFFKKSFRQNEKIYTKICKMTFLKIFMYKHLFVKTEVQISILAM